MEKLRVAQWGQLHSLYLPLYIAEKKGFFKAEGLVLDLSLAGNDDQVFSTVARGEADFGVGDPSFCARKANAKVQARVVATIVSRTGVFGITRLPVIPKIESVHDLVNLRVGSLPAPATTYALIKNLQMTNKRLLRSMRIIEAPIGEQYSLLAKGEADIVLDIEPFISIAESKGCRVIYSFAKFHGPYTFTGFYTRQEFIDRKPKVVRGAVRALNRAFALLAKDPKVGVEVSKQVFVGIDEAVLERAVRRLRAEKVWGKTAETDLAAWTNSLKVRAAIGDRFVSDAEGYVDNQFV